MDERNFLLWVGLVSVFAGGIGCVGIEFMSKDVGPARPFVAVTQTSDRDEAVVPTDPLKPDTLLTNYPDDNSSELNRSPITPSKEFELLQQIVCESLPSILPADGRITSKFGYRTSPFFVAKRKISSAARTTVRRGNSSIFHKGIDIAAVPGSYIIAAGSGRVFAAGYDAAYGNYIDIDHGRNITSRYAHASALFVREGDTVMAGSRIAIVGSSGRATGPHLHFEVLKNGRPIDPERYLVSGLTSRNFIVNSGHGRSRANGSRAI